MNNSVTLTRHERVGLIELNRPEVHNASDQALRQGLLAALDEVGRDPELRAVVLTGAGKSFCSGADLKSAAASPDQSLRRIARVLSHDYQAIVELMARLDKPVIAAINGAAVGIGMSLALACDLVLMADNAVLVPNFTDIALIADAGGAWFLTRRLGYGAAFEILAEGQRLPAARCKELGLANRLAPAEGLRQAALDWAAQLAARAPLALALTKRVARLSMSSGLNEVLSLEADLQTFLWHTADAKEALAAFNEKRKPDFNGG